MSHFRSPESIPPALSENLIRININLNSKPVLEVQLLHDENSGVIGSVPERTNKCNCTAFGIEKAHSTGIVIKGKTGERVCLDSINAFLLRLVNGDTEFAVSNVVLGCNSRLSQQPA